MMDRRQGTSCVKEKDLTCQQGTMPILQWCRSIQIGYRGDGCAGLDQHALTFNVLGVLSIHGLCMKVCNGTALQARLRAIAARQNLIAACYVSMTKWKPRPEAMPIGQTLKNY